MHQWGKWGQGEGKQFDFGSMMGKWGQGESPERKSYKAGTMTNSEFDLWKAKLVDVCPWFKSMEQKYIDGESEDAFPFEKTQEEMKAKKMEKWGSMMGGMMGKQHGDHNKVCNFVVYISSFWPTIYLYLNCFFCV